MTPISAQKRYNGSCRACVSKCKENAHGLERDPSRGEPLAIP